MFDNPKNSMTLRIIKTARDEKSINNAARDGFFPLVKKVEKLDAIRSKYAVLQNIETGEIEVIGDFRGLVSEYETVIDFTFYYPHNFPSPFAAYLIPKDLRIGERVFLEDLIEDYIGSSWNQGDVYRLESCEAIWDGKDFDIQHAPPQYGEFIG